MSEQQLQESQWPVESPPTTGQVPVLSRVAHDRNHTARALPDPAEGRPVRVLTVSPDGTAPVAEEAAGPGLVWDEQPELPQGAVYLGEAGGVPFAAVRGTRALTVSGRPVDRWAGLREVGAELAQARPAVDRPAAHSQRPLAAHRRVRDAVGLAEEHRTLGQLRLLVPHQPRTGRRLGDRDVALRADRQDPNGPALGRIRQRPGGVAAVVGDPRQHRYRAGSGPADHRPLRLPELLLAHSCAVPPAAAASASTAAGTAPSEIPLTSTAPSVRSGSAITFASPTTTAVSRPGAR